MRLFALGYGYTAATLARQLEARGGVSIRGTRRTATADGHVAFDGTARSPAIAQALHEATHVLVSIPPDAAGCPALRCFADDLATAPHLSWIGYLSTIGVYGDADGAWVDELTPLKPQSQRALRRASAEASWSRFSAQTGRRVDIFRLPGIYGPGRSAIDQLRAGTARRVVKPGQVFNRVHVEDIAGAVARAMTSTTAHRVFNVTDDEPAPPQDVVAYAASLLDVAPPPELPFASAHMSEMARSFYVENKRVRNTRMKAELGYALRYPTYREGLAAICAST